MILSLAVTILIEGIVVSGYSLVFKRPFVKVLLASFLANLLTQPSLWLGMNPFANHYLTALLVAEALIWIGESIFLYLFPGSGLNWKAALGLSLAMNLASFALGWWLPV